MTTVGINLKSLSDRVIEQGHTWKVGETSMTRLTLEEAKKRLGVAPPPGAPSIEDIDRMVRAGATPKAAFVAAAAVGAPSACDWRNVNGKSYVTPIRDQGGCGSCVAFGVTAVLESNLRIVLGNPDLDVDLSEAQLFYCYGRSQGCSCSSGWSPDAALDQCVNGLAFEKSFPYTAGDQDCKVDAGWKARYAKVSGKSFLSGAAIKDWISKRGPVTGCFIVYDDFFAYQGGIYHRVSNNQVGGHCISIVGYDDTQSCWICKNSWGPGWGEQGFFRIGYGECGIDTWLGPYGANDVSLVEAKAWSGWASEGGVLTSDVAVAQNADGRLEAFARGTDNAIWHKWQVAPNSGWSGWSSLGGVVLTPPCVTRNADGRLEVFAKGTDGAVWHNWQVAPNSGWSGWHSLGGRITSNIAAARNADGRLEIFVRGTEGAVWHNWQVAPNSGWSGWSSLGGVITSDIATARNADGRLEIFVRGTEGALWHKWQVAPNSGWSGWTSEGGVLASAPALARSPRGRLEVFARGTDNALWHKWQVAPNSGWSGWTSEGGSLIGNIAVATNADGRLEVFALGTDHALWHDWQTHPIAAPLTAVSMAELAAAMGPMPSVVQEMPTGAMLSAPSDGMPRGDMHQGSAATNGSPKTMPLGAMQIIPVAEMPAGDMQRSTGAEMPRGKMPPTSVLAATNDCNCGKNGIHHDSLHMD